ncbi:unnamed protein product (macronuclear) [Paramecium tetraurelia]|uniref:chitin synthase n=1 Tax=Paramecium tetraurelia TaxID=5888 RepID=A0BI78_PARTE|nr:uncharacterized protein GSPATT00029281001 [Paramecium tetraurelia]CAK58245.1 unnamed protein product [Paramecium tetraurelia]|eukprot:XP_001425643.1 hypothetical protein (macronuclear) [Paramecium tetraurelia strain d4-2]
MYISTQIGRCIVEEPDLKNRMLYKTLELELQAQGGLKVVKNTFQNDPKYELKNFDIRKRFDLRPQNIHSFNIQQNLQTQKIQNQEASRNLRSVNLTQRMVDQENITNHTHNGLLSALIHEAGQKVLRQVQQEPSSQQEQRLCILDNLDGNDMRLLVCITMFREPLTQLQKSIDGVVQSLDAFMKYGIAPHQIGVCVFFDGIENIHNVIDENGAAYHENIIPYFKSNLDEQYGIKDKKTLDYQYWEYKKHKKFLNDYNPQNIINLRKNKELLLKKYKKYKDSLLPIMKAQKGYQWMPQDEWVETNIIQAMIRQYQLSKQYIQDRENTAWVYQGRHVYQECTMPIFYVFKFKNGSKLSSHLWFFKGFCQELKPDYCLLMDCGAVPAKDSIFKLISSMEADPKVGGVCGNMRIEEEMDILSKILNKHFFSIKKCQQCEYDIGHTLDKNYESALNYIHVLPGAFSAYRYKAFSQHYIKYSKQSKQIQLLLQNQHKNTSDNQPDVNVDIDNQQSSQQVIPEENYNILNFYLRQVMESDYQYSSITEANMFLAEDRVLCLLLFCQDFYLKYIPDAIVYVDACQSLIDLLFQRRRWINGSWFALNYVQETYHDKLEGSSHTWEAKQMLKFSIITANLNQLQQYFFQSFQIVWLFMVLQTVVDSNGTINDRNYNHIQESTDNIVVSAIIGLYILLVLMLVYLSLTYDQQILNNVNGTIGQSKKQVQEQIKNYYYSRYYFVSTILGLMSLATVGYTVYLLIQQIILELKFSEFLEVPNAPQSYYSLLIVLNFGMLGLPFLFTLMTQPSIILSVIVNSIHYFYFQPTYTHLFITYAFCRIDDLSWGTKGLTEDNSKNKVFTDKIYKKYLFVIKWIVLNCLLSGILILLLRMNISMLPSFLILFVSVILTVISIIKGFLAIIHLIQFYMPSGTKARRDKLINRVDKRRETLERGKTYNTNLQQFFMPQNSR